MDFFELDKLKDETILFNVPATMKKKLKATSKKLDINSSKLLRFILFDFLTLTPANQLLFLKRQFTKIHKKGK